MAYVEVVVRACVAVIRINFKFMTAEAVRAVLVIFSSLAKTVLEGGFHNRIGHS